MANVSSPQRDFQNSDGSREHRRGRRRRHHHRSRSAKLKRLAQKLLLALVILWALWFIADMIVKRSNEPSSPESRGPLSSFVVSA